MADDYIICSKCGEKKVWYRFPFNANKAEPQICCICINRKQEIKQQLTELRIENLIRKSMASKMSDLRDELFETLKKVKTKEIEISQAKSVCEIAQVIINSAKVEIDFMKAINAKNGSGFIEVTNQLELGNCVVN